MEKNIIKGFASDNNAGIHPEILKELASVNSGHVIGYGADIYTEKARMLFRQHLGDDTESFLVFNGTGANVLGISSVVHSWNSVITADTAHLQQDECGAPEKFSGCKVLTVITPDGKLTVDLIEKHMHGFDFEHHAQPKVVSISQSTELGTVYNAREIKTLADYVHSRGLILHMDGARLANAAVSLNLPFKAFTTDAGVDILSFGGTKNGMMLGEAVCFLKPGLSSEFKYVRKQGMQLASKMRFISAQFIAYFRNDLWKQCASHSNQMALKLSVKLQDIKQVKITQPVQANGVFVIMPDDVAERVRQDYFFFSWNEKRSEYRLMTSWDTTEADIEKFADLVKQAVAGKK